MSLVQKIAMCSKCQMFHDGILKGECNCNCHKVQVGDIFLQKNKDGTTHELEVTNIESNGMITFKILSMEHIDKITAPSSRSDT